MMEDDENDVQDGLLEEDDDARIIDADSETPPHLRDLAAAAQSGDLSALRLALGLYLFSLLSTSLLDSFLCLFVLALGFM